MESKQQLELYAVADERRRKITVEKGREYTGQSQDVLANFKRIGERLGLPPLVVLAVYLNKHVDSINTFVKRNLAGHGWGDGPPLYVQVAEGEGIVSRLDDVRNYYDLMEALLQDELEAEQARQREYTSIFLRPITVTETKPPLFTDRGQGMGKGHKDGCRYCTDYPAGEWPDVG